MYVVVETHRNYMVSLLKISPSNKIYSHHYSILFLYEVLLLTFGESGATGKYTYTLDTGRSVVG